MNEPQAELQTPDSLTTERFDWEERAWPREWMPVFLRSLSTVPVVADACRTAGISRQQAYASRNGEPERPDGRPPVAPVEGFSAAWDEALERSVDLLERKAFEVATVGAPHRETRTYEKTDGGGVVVERQTVTVETRQRSNGVMLRVLEAHRPHRWARRLDHRHSGGDGPPIQIEASPFRYPTRERIHDLLAVARELEENGVPMVIEGSAVEIEPSENGAESGSQARK